ncbi:MAG: ATP-binding protein [Dehalococcoidia bacterium]|nr:ATP-binding protein [Dehalococcoidia bacterium]
MRDGTTPGMNPSLHMDHFTSDEQKIIQAFAREWYVTNGGKEFSLNPTSRYKYFLMKPADNYQEMFNLDREIVVVFSPYKTFQPRTLDAFDYAVKHAQQLRVERVCGVLVSGDNSVESRLTSLLKKNPESQIVVPFSYDELLCSFDDYFLRNRFKRHFFTRDLFAMEGPLRKDLYFFGRNDLIQELVSRHTSGENSALFGLRKTGKTSIVYGVKRALEREGGKCAVIDCQNTAFHRRRWNTALAYILAEARRQNGLDASSVDDTSFTEQNAAVVFEEGIKQLLKDCETESILVIFDEIENISFEVSPSKHWATDLDFLFLWQTLRALYQKLDAVFSYLIVGTNPLCIERATLNGKDNPLFNQVPYQYVPGFDVPQTREMVRTMGRIMGLKFEEILYGKLTEDYGGHPFLIRHACSTVHRLSESERPVQVAKLLYEKARTEFEANYVTYVEMILEVLRQYYPDEYLMLEYLARGDTAVFSDYAANHPSYTTHLLGYGVLQKSDGGYSFRIEAVRNYLYSLKRYEKLQLTASEAWHEVSERRNALEVKLRRVVRLLMLAKYGPEQALIQIKTSLPPKTKIDDSVTLSTLLNDTESPLHFSDLRRIVLDNWGVFLNVFGSDKNGFDTRMRTVNSQRIDAHAKGIDPPTMTYFRLCISGLEKQVGDYLV